jgi:predicted AAA+ superfamily ATPase
VGREYIPRIAGGELDGALERAGAILIEGPKACGKTETATRRAASVVHHDADPSVPGHLADPSLALALVGGDAAALRRNLGFAGQLFESLVVHDLRVLAQPLSGDVFHARDLAGREIDAIIQFPSGRWAGFEVKLGASADTVDAAAAGLLGFAANVDTDAGAGGPC